MNVELPILRLGLAGFSAAQKADLQAVLHRTAGGGVQWDLGELEGADAWVVNGVRVQDLGEDRIRISPGVPTARSVQLHLPDVDRPIAFSLPLASPELQPLYSFDPTSSQSMADVLHKFEAWLAPTVAQFCLAAHIVEHETALRSGVFDLSRDGRLLALVSMHADTAVSPTATPADFEDAVWGRESVQTRAPEHFVRASMSQLMWQYAVRTRRDVLPRHYRRGLLYFRRAPRLPQRVLNDSHLLLLRELASAPATFETLLALCGLDEVRLAHDLAALYFVGSITSNPKRAGRYSLRNSGPDPGSTDSQALPSGMGAIPVRAPRRGRIGEQDPTAPAPIGPE